MNASTWKGRLQRSLVSDAAGRDLFLPWLPFSRTAYVLPNAGVREEFARRIERSLFFSAGAAAAFLLTFLFGRPSGWLGLLIAAMIVAKWHGWTRRSTRGLERTRYEKPAA